MMRIFESLLEESNKKKFIKNWLGDDTEKVDEYDKAYEEYRQVFDNEIKKRGLNWQTSMNLSIFEEILNGVNERKSKAELKKQNKAAGKSDFLSYVLANPDCDLTYLGTLYKWDYFKIETWPGAMLADSPKASLNGDTGAKWCIGWSDPTKQKFDEYTSAGFDFVLIVKSDSSNKDEEEKYCIHINRKTGFVEAIWTPIDDPTSDKIKIGEILYGQEFKTKDRRLSGIFKSIDIGFKEIIQPENKIVDIDYDINYEDVNNDDAFTEDTFHYKLYKSGTDQVIDDSVTTLEFIDLERIPKFFFNLVKLDNLEKIILPEGLKVIREKCFYTIEHIRYSSLSNVKYIEIPESVEEIGDLAFYCFKSLESIKIPANLKKIGNGAFNSCKSLKHVELPDSVEEIGEYAFGYCDSLESFKIPANLKRISNGMFSYSGLKHIEIPESIEEIGNKAFLRCDRLRHIEIPESIEEIGNYVFNGCRGLESIKLPANLKRIGKQCFQWCESLKHIEIPDSVEELGAYTFSGCRDLESIKLPASLKRIGKSCFMTCRKLKHIEIPDLVEEIGASAFSECGSLWSVKMPANLRKIGVYAFTWCESLKHIEIPDFVEEIGEGAFAKSGITNQDLIDKNQKHR